MKKKRAKLVKPKIKDKRHPPTYHLRNVLDVRRFLSRVANELYQGELAAVTAGRIAYICNIILKSFEINEYAKELQEIRERIDAIESDSH